MVFSNLPCTKYEFLHDGANKAMTFYTFSVRQITPESKNLRTTMKNINENKMKGSISTLTTLFSAKMKFLKIIFGLGDVSTSELKTQFRKIFLKASLSQNLQKSGFSSAFRPNVFHKNTNNFRCNDIEKFSEKFQKDICYFSYL